MTIPFPSFSLGFLSAFLDFSVVYFWGQAILIFSEFSFKKARPKNDQNAILGVHQTGPTLKKAFQVLSARELQRAVARQWQTDAHRVHARDAQSLVFFPLATFGAKIRDYNFLKNLSNFACFRSNCVKFVSTIANSSSSGVT